MFSPPAAVDALIGNPAGDLEPDPRLYRDHPDPRYDRMDPPRPCSTIEAAGIARGGFLYRRGADGREARANHRPASATELYEPPDRLGYPDGPRHDPRRDRAFLSRLGAAAADDELGSAAQRSAKHQRRSALSVADASRRLYHHHRPSVQFLRRRTTRRCRPLSLMGADVRGKTRWRAGSIGCSR